MQCPPTERWLITATMQQTQKGYVGATGPVLGILETILLFKKAASVQLPQLKSSTLRRPG